MKFYAGSDMANIKRRLSLHALTFSNPRAVAHLWSKFVRELRFSYWEPGISLPRMGKVFLLLIKLTATNSNSASSDARLQTIVSLNMGKGLLSSKSHIEDSDEMLSYQETQCNDKTMAKMVVCEETGAGLTL